MSLFSLQFDEDPTMDGLEMFQKVHKPVFFNLFAAAEPSANVCVSHGTLCNDSSVYIATTV